MNEPRNDRLFYIPVVEIRNMEVEAFVIVPSRQVS